MSQQYYPSTLSATNGNDAASSSSSSLRRTPSSSRTVSTPLAVTPTGSRSNSPIPGSSSTASTSADHYFQPSHERSSSLDTAEKRRASQIYQEPVEETRGSSISKDATQEEKMAAMEEHQRRYADNRESLVQSIQKTGGILTQLKDFNQKKWIVHYPLIDTKSIIPPGHGVLRRTQTMAPAEQQQIEDRNQAAADANKAESSRKSASSPPSPPAQQPPTLHRSYTDQVHSATAIPRSPGDDSEADFSTTSIISNEPTQEEVKQQADDTAEMSVLKLDLKLGANSSRQQALVRTLEKSSVAHLLDDRFNTSLRQLDSLKMRISDTQSKVLVTGDLNAGKSTFVNALMRRKMMPVDQQPCTTVFCEVLDATEINEGKEEVHMVHPGMLYDVQNASSYSRHSVEDIERIVAEAEELSPEDAPMLKCYCHDTRATQESLLRNGVVDIALIDAPGLNRDSLKTTALFARQEEIDVVVFVVSAENHFTLSAKEFLWNASNDKAYIFIVVNKFDQIHNKEKCKRLVLEQIRQLSPRTYEDAAELVHFVDSSAVMGSQSGANTPMHDEFEFPKVGKVSGDDEGKVGPAAMGFAQLEACLRDFVLQRREKSKLLPAQTYLLRLLTDIEMLSTTNLDVAGTELQTARNKLIEARPALAKALNNQAKLFADLETEEDTVVSDVGRDAEVHLSHAVNLIGQGKPASATLSLPEWPGIFNAHYYAADVRDVFIRSLEAAVSEAEQAARKATAESIVRIESMGKSRLPEEVEGTQRVFNPSAMFAKRMRNRKRNMGVAGLGLGLSDDISSAKVSDVLDISHYFSIVSHAATGRSLDEVEDDAGERGSAVSRRRSRHTDDDESALISSGLSIGGLGALTLLGGKVYGARSALDTMANLSNLSSLVSNPTVRKWGPYALALATVGLAAYVVQDLPKAIPKNVGKSMKKELLHGGSARRSSRAVTSSVEDDADSSVVVPSTATSESISFTASQVYHISREVRKVLRLMEFDLQERFRCGIAERQNCVDQLQEKEEKSLEALEWFEEIKGQSEVVKGEVKAIKMV